MRVIRLKVLKKQFLTQSERQLSEPQKRPAKQTYSFAWVFMTKYGGNVMKNFFMRHPKEKLISLIIGFVVYLTLQILSATVLSGVIHSGGWPDTFTVTLGWQLSY